MNVADDEADDAPHRPPDNKAKQAADHFARYPPHKNILA
jgi:hypothetical protein